MTKIAYINRDFSIGSRTIIMQANAIIAEYAEAGFTLTLRQLYYQFVSRDYLANSQANYNRLGSIINDARLAGKISWTAIEDRTRNLRTVSSWDSPADILESARRAYRRDLWARQRTIVEVWIEKDALMGVIEPTCHKERVAYYACRGYNSQSEQWRAAQRVIERFDMYGQDTVILHLGDHDPSGMDMSRDLADRFGLMEAGNVVTVKRLALNMDQVKKYNPPPNPAKLTDSRADAYIAEHGSSSWELDALSPKVIAAVIKKHIDAVRDEELWQEDLDRENRERRAIAKAIETLDIPPDDGGSSDAGEEPGEDDEPEEE